MYSVSSRLLVYTVSSRLLVYSVSSRLLVYTVSSCHLVCTVSSRLLVYSGNSRLLIYTVSSRLLVYTQPWSVVMQRFLCLLVTHGQFSSLVGRQTMGSLLFMVSLIAVVSLLVWPVLCLLTWSALSLSSCCFVF